VLQLGALSLRIAQIARTTVTKAPDATTELCQGGLRIMATTPQAYARMIAAVARMFFVFRLMGRPSTARLTQPLNLWKLACAITH